MTDILDRARAILESGGLAPPAPAISVGEEEDVDVLARARRILAQGGSEDPARTAARERLETAKIESEQQWEQIQNAPQEHPLAQLGRVAGRDARNVGKAGVRALEMAGETARGAGEMLGTAIQSGAQITPESVQVSGREIPVEAPVGPLQEQVGQLIRDVAGYGARGEMRPGEVKSEAFAREPGYIPEDFWEGMKSDPIRTLTINGIENLGPLAGTMAAAYAAGPAGGLTAGLAMESGAAFNEAKEAGASDEQAVRAAGATGVANMVLEYLPAGKALSRLAGKAPRREVLRFIRDVTEQAALEGVTESTQEMNNILIAGATYAEDNDLGWEDVKRIGAAGLIGAAMGGGVGAVTSAGAGTLGETETTSTREETQDGNELSDRPPDQPEPGPHSEPDQGRGAQARAGSEGQPEVRQEVALPAEATPPPALTPSVERGEGEVTTEEPEVEILSFEETDRPGEIASHAGQAGESAEAISRQRSGNRYYRVRPSGEVVPIPGVDAVDVRVGKGEAKVLVGPRGEVTLVDGRLSRPMQDAVDGLRAPETEAGSQNAAEAPVLEPQSAPEATAEPGGAEVATETTGEPSGAISPPRTGPLAEGERVRWGEREGVVASGGEYRGTVRVNFDDGRSEVLAAGTPARVENATPEPASDFLPEQPKDFTAQGGFIGSKAKAESQPSPLAFSNPEVEAGFQRGRRGPQKESLFARIKETATKAGQSARRELKYIPSGAKFAPFRESMRRLRTHDPSNEVARELNEVVSPLNDQQYELFQRKTLLDDLDVIAQRYEAGTELPFGITQADIAADKPRVDEAAESDPYVKRALERSREVWTKAREKYREGAKALGMDTSFLDKRGDAYLHHQVIEYALRDGKRQSRKVAKPKGRGFQRELRGSVQDIDLRYGAAQGQVLTQLRLDAELAAQLARTRDKYSIHEAVKKRVKEASKGDKKVTFESQIPEGYRPWQPDEGSIFYMGQTITDRIAKRLLEEGANGVKITPEDIRQAMVVGGRKETWVLPEEIVQTLEELGHRRTNEVSRVNQSVVRAWKKLMLLMPRRFFKYATRNLVGDTQKTAMGNPAAFGKFKQAASELGSYVYAKKKPSADLAAWMVRGGWSSGLFQQELEETEAGRQQRLKMATEVAGELEKVKDLKKLPARYFAWAGKNVSYLEAINRYANYLSYMEQMKANPDGKPKNYGASRPDEIMGLADFEDRAYWLSNQLIGAYDQVSEMGQLLRRHFVPFWSFQELNMRSHWGLIRNAVTNPDKALTTAERMGVAVKGLPPMVAWRVAKLAGLMASFEAFMHAWNYGLFEDEEDDLPQDIRRTPHIVLGRDDEGNVLYFNRLSVFYEAREWFGIDEFGYGLMDYLDGRISGGQLLKEVASIPLNKAINAIGPVSAGGVKSIFELATKKTTFPEPRDIHDRWDYAYRTIGMEEEFRAASGRPTPSGGYAASWKNAFIYASEPGAAAYYDTLSSIRRFKHSTGDDSTGSYFGSKTEALRNYKRAIRYGQPDLAEKYLRLYVAAGGTAKGFEQSLDRMSPDYGMKKDWDAFQEWLTPDEKLKLEDAMQYYEEVFGPDSPGTEEGLKFIEKLEDEADDKTEAEERDAA